MNVKKIYFSLKLKIGAVGRGLALRDNFEKWDGSLLMRP